MKKVIAILWIVLTVIVNTLAISGMLYHAGVAHTVWRGPFATLGQTYLGIIDRLFTPIDSLTNAIFGWVAPFWVLHLIIAYVSIASAIMVWGWLQQKPKNLAARFKTAGRALAWIAGLPRLLLQSLRGQNKGRAAVGYVMALLATYGVSRSFNAGIETGNGSTETVYYDEYCSDALNKHHRARPFLQDNFDKAATAENWKRAEQKAKAMVDLTTCLSGQGKKIDTARQYLNIDSTFYDPEQANIDFIRVQLESADAFYAGEQWKLARDYYAPGLDAFDALVSSRRGEYDYAENNVSASGYRATSLSVTESDIDMAVLFNLEALHRQWFQLYGASRQLRDNPDAPDFTLNDIYSAVRVGERVRNDFYNTSESERGEMRPQFYEHSRAFLPNLLSDLIDAAKFEQDPNQQILAAHLLRDLLRQQRTAHFADNDGIEVHGGVPPIELIERRIETGKTIEDEYSKQSAAETRSLAPLELMITSLFESDIIRPTLDAAAYSQAPLTEAEKGNLRAYRDTSTRFINVFTAMPVEMRAAILSPTTITDPYPNYIAISNLLDEKDDAYLAMQKQLHLHFDNEIAGISGSPFTNSSNVNRLQLMTTRMLAKDQELDQYNIYDILNDDSLPETHAVKKRWAKLTDRLCLNMKRQGWDFSDQTCADYLRDLLYRPRGEPYVGATEPFSAATQAMTREADPLSIDIDLLFGTTRAYNPDSKLPEKLFTRKDEPNGYGRRGSVTLSAPLSELGPPLLANALIKGEERADIFEFVGMPEIYGYGPEAEARFRAELVKRLEDANHGEALIYVHGVGNTFPNAAKRTAQLSYDLSFPGVAMFYTWPTESNFLGYFKDVDVPKMAIEDLASFIEDSSESSTKVHIIAHSHGARVTVDALKQLIKDRKADGKDLKLGQVILAAPDVNGKKLKKAVDKYLSPVSDRVTVYTNNSDGALWLSSMLRFFKWRGGLGKSGDTCAAQLIDASSAVPFGSHGYFAKESEVLADLRTLIWHSGIAPAQRCYLQAKSENSTASWKFAKNSCDITAYDLASQISIKGRQIASVDFDMIYADLVKKNEIESAESQDGQFNPDDWKIINPSDGTIGSANPVVVARERYDTAVNVHTTLQAASASTATAGCAP